MLKISEITEPYFSHNMYPQADKKIVMLLEEMGYEGYGLYWKIVEFMHRNELCVDEERLVAGKNYTEKVISILNNFNLFRVEEEKYVSDRIQRNIKKQEKEFEKKSKAANTRWILSSLKNSYIEIFGKAPVLDDKEVQIFLKYANTIEDFKKKLPDILFTTKCLKFDNNPKFNPNINWLLSENHLGKLLNGEYGKLKSWTIHKEKLKKAEEEEQKIQTSQNKVYQQQQQEEELILTCNSKAAAIELIVNNTMDKTFRVIIPKYKELMKKFDITVNELKKTQGAKN